jgi:adenylate cyclase class IV
MIEPKELEYKYNATKVDLQEFEQLMTELGYDKKLEVSSWDEYYTTGEREDQFIRHRKGKVRPELTLKRKINSKNNWERMEVNIELALDNDKANDVAIHFFCDALDYKKNFKIYKSCFIYFFEDLNTVYYTVYDKNMNEIGRFIEIEYNEEKLSEDLEKAEEDSDTVQNKAFARLKEIESKLTTLGISAKNRLKKSLFEMFKK